MPATVLNFLFVPGRSRVTPLPCWPTSLTAPRTMRSRHLPQSLTPSPIPPTPPFSFPINLHPSVATAASAFCQPPCYPQPEAQVSAGLGLCPQFPRRPVSPATHRVATDPQGSLHKPVSEVECIGPLRPLPWVCARLAREASGPASVSPRVGL